MKPYIFVLISASPNSLVCLTMIRIKAFPVQLVTPNSIKFTNFTQHVVAEQ